MAGGMEQAVSIFQPALARPYSGYHRSIAGKAAAVLHSMVNNHGFVDGNKRTAWLLVELLIDRSGYTLNIEDDAHVDDLVVAVADGQLDHAELVTWFKARLLRR